MNEHHGATVASAISYITSAGLVVGQIFDFMNQNAGAFGVILGFLTFFINWHYQHKRYKSELK